MLCVFFCKQKTAYEMRISDWSSDVCSSDLLDRLGDPGQEAGEGKAEEHPADRLAPFGPRLVIHGEAGGGQAEHHHRKEARHEGAGIGQIGRASCGVRVCQYVSISALAAA